MLDMLVLVSLSSTHSAICVSAATNNLWVIIAALLVFTMAISAGLLEMGELENKFSNGLTKTAAITILATVVMEWP